MLLVAAVELVRRELPLIGRSIAEASRSAAGRTFRSRRRSLVHHARVHLLLVLLVGARVTLHGESLVGSMLGTRVGLHGVALVPSVDGGVRVMARVTAGNVRRGRLLVEAADAVLVLVLVRLREHALIERRGEELSLTLELILGRERLMLMLLLLLVPLLLLRLLSTESYEIERRIGG